MHSVLLRPAVNVQLLIVLLSGGVLLYMYAKLSCHPLLPNLLILHGDDGS